MRPLLSVGALLVVTHLFAFSQSSSTRITGVVEPPELTGEPNQVTKLTEPQRQFGKIVGEMRDEQTAKAIRPKLAEFVGAHPDYSDALFIRALCDLCMLHSHDYVSILKDVEAAISKHSSAANSSIYTNLIDHYSMRGQLRFATGHYREAVDDLEAAMKVELNSADKIFNISGVEPEKTSDPCTWNLSELDTLISKFPNDYRGFLFRGLYFKFFTTFKEDYYATALQQFQKAAIVNPRSPLPPYFIGDLYTKASFWTKAAWASDKGRDEPKRKAIQAYTRAIQLDPNFAKAYEGRASAYYSLKQNQLAIRDYDKVLELDPNNTTAYSDRGLAKLESGQYLVATFDLGSAIRTRSQDNSFLPNLYESRGDAYMKIGQYGQAIADYSKAIERRLSNDTFVLSLKQFRGLYPEYDNVSDEVLIRKINALFWPNFEYSVLAAQLLEKNGKWQISLLNDLYEKRGDAYLKANDFRRGVLDFNRIFKGIPNFANTVDRWRLLGSKPGGEAYYVDVKSVTFTDNGPASLWLKIATNEQKYMVESYELDCNSRRINHTSSIAYEHEKVVHSSQLSSGWQRIIPDTLGEQVYNGLCSATYPVAKQH